MCKDKKTIMVEVFRDKSKKEAKKCLAFLAFMGSSAKIKNDGDKFVVLQPKERD